MLAGTDQADRAAVAIKAEATTAEPTTGSTLEREAKVILLPVFQAGEGTKDEEAEDAAQPSWALSL